MDAAKLRQWMESPDSFIPWFESSGVVDLETARRNICSIHTDGMPLDLLARMLDRLSELLPQTGDPDGALNNLQRFIASSRSPQALGGLFDRDPDSLPTLLRIFSVSQYLADQLINDPDCFDMLRMTEGQGVSREVLCDEVLNEILACSNEGAVLRVLRDFRHRETLRIAFGDFIGLSPVEMITEQNSILAEALCEAAYRSAWKSCSARYGTPMTPQSVAARFSVIALGKLGGNELNYSSDIDLMYIAETDGKTEGGKSIANQEFFDRLAQAMTRFLSEVTANGRAYRVDLRLRPYGKSGPMVSSLESALNYYEASGRTWERQAFIKGRCVAGDMVYGQQFLDRMQPWIFRRYLTAADISGIKALKRRIENGSREAGTEDRNVKTGRGGIRDIEFVIQFLQLLNGSDWEPIRTGNTLVAISRLEQVGCLTPSERTLLEEGYRFLRRVEHHLQIMFDHQTHVLPESDEEQEKLAKRLGFEGDSQGTALQRFKKVLAERTELNRRILDHLLHDAFGDEEEISDETDLVLDPEPSTQRIEAVLGKYAFEDPQAAHRLLIDLSSERVPFLSTRRCRHFLAAIAEKLLAEIAKTPSPEATLLNLTRISDSLGGKGVLWELFSFHRPSLVLCVRLCATSPYLVGILTANPGMIDELLDSLMLESLPSAGDIEAWIDELCRGAVDTEPILHAFKNSMHLRIGIRDILGKEELTETHHALANVAESCLRQIINVEYQKLIQRFGVPTTDAKEDAEFIVLGLGKLGGREPNYHSDLDVMFLFDADGNTRSLLPTVRHQATSNRQFFNQLAQRVSQSVNRLTRYGKLYELDTRLRPLGKSGSLAISLQDLQDYFDSGTGQPWERQLLCKARVVWGSERAARSTMAIVRKIVVDAPRDVASEIIDMRSKMEVGASPYNLKRGVGGTVDVEFTVQYLQLTHAKEYPDILVPGTMEAIQLLGRNGLLTQKQASLLYEGYLSLRRMESCLRLMNTIARHDLPNHRVELERLAFLLHLADGQEIPERCQQIRQTIREIYREVVGAVGRG